MPVLTPITITGTLKNAAGVVYSRKQISFTPTQIFGGTGVSVLPDTITAITAENGTFSVTLYTVDTANAFVRYAVVTPEGDTFNIDLAANSPTTLDALYAQGELANAGLTAVLAAIATQAAIGGAVPGGTAGSVLFVGAGGVRAQDNANFFYDDANNILSVARLFLGGSAAQVPLNIKLAASQTADAFQVFASDGVTKLTAFTAAGKSLYDTTITAGGTTGARTIDKPTGTVNFAAAATSLVVTNSLVTTSSIVFAVVRTGDSTAYIRNVIPAAGSFTITLGAAATAETSVGFLVIN